MATRHSQPKGLPPHVRRKKAKGNTYYYFDTGRRSAKGAPVLERLPDINDKFAFGKTYASKLGVRNKGFLAVGPTVSQLIDRYQRSKEFNKLAASTRAQYNIYLLVIEKAIGVAPVGEVTKPTVLDLMDTMANRPGAGNATLRCLRALYAWAKERELVSANPAAGIDLNTSRDYEPWSETLVAEAFEDADRRVRLGVGLLYFTAQRIGDVCRLRWSDIINGVLFVTQQKTKKPLEIPIHPRLDLILGPRPNGDRPLLPKMNGEHYDPDTIRDVLQAFAAKRGHKIVPHGLRKNAVNSLLECGCTAAETASVSGQSLQLVEHYAKKRRTGKLAARAVGKWEGPSLEGK